MLALTVPIRARAQDPDAGHLASAKRATMPDVDESQREERAPQRLAVIVNPKNRLPAMPEKEVEGLFLLDRRVWKSGGPKVMVVMRALGSDFQRLFERRVLKQQAKDLQPTYAEAIRRGTVRVVDSDEDAVAAVASDPAAIAFVWESAVTPAVRVASLVSLEGEDPRGPAATALYGSMDVLRDLWDQLEMALRDPNVPPADLARLAQAISRQATLIPSRLPRGNDAGSRYMQGLARQLMVRTEVLPRMVQEADRNHASAALREIEETICVTCHRQFRE